MTVTLVAKRTGGLHALDYTTGRARCGLAGPFPIARQGIGGEVECPTCKRIEADRS